MVTPRGEMDIKANCNLMSIGAGTGPQIGIQSFCMPIHTEPLFHTNIWGVCLQVTWRRPTLPCQKIRLEFAWSCRRDHAEGPDYDRSAHAVGGQIP
jgi:hypothetical protein